MLQCVECDYLQPLQDYADKEYCNYFICKYTNHVFSSDDFFNINEYPCCNNVKQPIE